MSNEVDIAQQRAKVLNRLWPQGKQHHKQAIEFVNFYLEPKGFIKSILNYLFNDSFGSLFELRQRLMSVFNCPRFSFSQEVM